MPNITRAVINGKGPTGRPVKYYGLDVPTHIVMLEEELHVRENKVYVFWKTENGNGGSITIRSPDITTPLPQIAAAAITAMQLTD